VNPIGQQNPPMYTPKTVGFARKTSKNTDFDAKKTTKVLD
jgi:hypothetical protein